MENYSFSAKFYSTAKVVVPTEIDKFRATASLKSLKGLLPEGINPNDRPDLLYLAANSANIAMRNLNGDSISLDTGLDICTRNNLYLNVDHGKQVVGVWLYPGLSEYGTSTLIDAARARELGVCNLSLAGVVWRAIDKDLVKMLIDSSDESSPNYGSVSTSWEIFFNEYDICVGKTGLVKDDRIITDPLEIAKFSPILQCNGGKGTYNDEYVYRVITGTNTYITGYSLVRNPAAHVKGIVTITEPQKVTTPEQTSAPANVLTEPFITQLKNEKETGMGFQICDVELLSGVILNDVKICNCDTLPENIDANHIKSITVKTTNAPGEIITVELPKSKEETQDNLSQTHKSISQEINPVVNPIIPIIMKIESTKDISAQWNEFAKLDAATAGSYFDKVISEQLKEASVKYSTDLAAKDGALAKAQEDINKAAASVLALEKELAEIKAKASAAAAEEKFQARMAEISNDYDLDDEDKSVVAADVKCLGDDDSFAAFKKKFSVLAKEKSKKFKADNLAKAAKLESELAALKAKAGQEPTAEEVALKALAAAKLIEDEKNKITAGLKLEETNLLKSYQEAFAPAKVLKQ